MDCAYYLGEYIEAEYVTKVDEVSSTHTYPISTNGLL